MLSRKHWIYILDQNCKLEYDDEVGRFWRVPGVAHIYVSNLSKVIRGTRLFCEDTFMIVARVESEKVKRAYVPWEHIVFIDFLDDG